MAVEGNSASVDQHLFISFDDHAVIMAGHRARAFIAHAGDCLAQYRRLLSARLYFTAVRCGIADTNDSAHFSLEISPSNVPVALEHLDSLNLPPPTLRTAEDALA